jgi:hypothetical protein
MGFELTIILVCFAFALVLAGGAAAPLSTSLVLGCLLAVGLAIFGLAYSFDLAAYNSYVAKLQVDPPFWNATVVMCCSCWAICAALFFGGFAWARYRLLRLDAANWDVRVNQ